jgi:hypothetical protein
LELLVGAGCDVGLKTGTGQTGRELAAEQGNAALVVRPGRGRIVALHHRASTSHQIHERIRRLDL